MPLEEVCYSLGRDRVTAPASPLHSVPFQSLSPRCVLRPGVSSAQGKNGTISTWQKDAERVSFFRAIEA